MDNAARIGPKTGTEEVEKIRVWMVDDSSTVRDGLQSILHFHAPYWSALIRLATGQVSFSREGKSTVDLPGIVSSPRWFMA